MDVGQQLSEARQRRKLTLADISRTTKIPLHLLQAIERNDIAHLPQPFFRRAFVRAYANEVGVNPADVLDHLEPLQIDQIEIPLPVSRASGDKAYSWVSVCVLLTLGVAFNMYGGFTSGAAQSQPPVGIANPAPLSDRAEVVASVVPPATVDREEIAVVERRAPISAAVEPVEEVVAAVSATPTPIDLPEPVTAGEPAASSSVVESSPVTPDLAISPADQDLPATLVVQ